MAKKSTPLECRDTALALAFLLLLIWFFSGRAWFAYLAMATLLFAMIWPKGMTPIAKLWFGLSHALGEVVNKVVLGAAYILVLLPMALVRKMMGKDSMGLGRWKDGSKSAFVTRDHLYVKDDLDNAF